MLERYLSSYLSLLAGLSRLSELGGSLTRWTKKLSMNDVTHPRKCRPSVARTSFQFSDDDDSNHSLESHRSHCSETLEHKKREALNSKRAHLEVKIQKSLS